MKKSIEGLVALLLLGSMLLSSCGIPANEASGIDRGKQVRTAEKLELFKTAMTEEIRMELNDLRIAYAQYGSAQVPVMFYSPKYQDFYSKEYQDLRELEGILAIYGTSFATQKMYAYKPGEARYFKELTYEEMQKQPAIYEDDIHVIYSNMNEHFMEDVVMTCYTLQEQDTIPIEYKKHMEKLLLEMTPNPPPVIIERAWQVDLDGDGKNETIVKGTNYCPAAAEQASASESDTYSSTELVDYHLLSLFSDTLGVYDLYKEINVTNLVGNNYMALSLSAFSDLDESQSSEVGNYYNLYQWSDNGEIITVPVYLSMYYDGFGACQVMACDVNGDGLIDLCTFIGEMYPIFSAFIQKPNSSLPGPRMIVFPA